MKYKAGFKYQLHDGETFHTALHPKSDIRTNYITLLMGGTLKVRKGYAWDGPSGPTWDSANSMRGSLLHDAAYQLLRMGYLDPKWRSIADEELDRLLREDGMWWPRRKLWVRALKRFGSSAADPKNKKKVLTAP